MSDSPWRNLDPYRPVPGGDGRYVRRPADMDTRLAESIRAGLGGGRIGLSGPPGVGKSTELLAAAEQLLSTHGVFLIRLDEELDLRHAEQIELVQVLGRRIKAAGAVASPPKMRHLPGATKLLPRSAFSQADEGRGATLRERLDALDELLRDEARSRPVALLVDGLEKAPDEQARAAILLLCEIAGRAGIGLAIVLSPSSVTGPAAHEVLQRLKTLELRALMVSGNSAEAESGRRFLSELFTHRTGLSLVPGGSTEALVSRAAELSGGIPRVFLQLLQDAAGYAWLAQRDEPSLDDLQQAARDHGDSLAALLTAGDLSLLNKVAGRDVHKLDAALRARLLSHGLMLARGRGKDLILEPHPLLERLLRPAKASE